jgi:hypothetical protein
MGATTSHAYVPDRAAIERDQAPLLRAFDGHAEQASMMLKPTFDQDGQHYAMRLCTFNFDVKAKAGATALADCAPLLVEHMSTGMTHRKCVLVGEVASAGIFTGGIYFLLEDPLGGMVKIGVYGIPGACARLAASAFCRGRRVAIVDPFFKVGADGAAFVRVDEPSEVHSVPAVCWKELGTDFLKRSSMPSAAASCYGCGIASVVAPAAILLTNRSNANLRLGHTACAVRDAAAAALLDQGNAKALHHLAQSLLQSDDAALREVGEQLRIEGEGLFPRVAASFKLLRDPLVKPAPSAGAPWWETPSLVNSLIEDGPLPSRGVGTWEELKLAGNQHFLDGKYRDAVAAYSTGLQLYASSTELVTLLLNHATAVLDADPLGAVRSASAAIVIDCNRAKAWWRRAHALEAVKLFDSALQSAESGLAVAGSGDNKPFERLVQRLKRAVLTQPTAHPRVTTADLERERAKTTKGLRAKEVVPVSAMGEFRKMIDMIPSEHARRKMREHLFGNEPMVHFHEEYAACTEWPPGVNPARGMAHLAGCYETAAPLPFMMQSAFATETYTFQESDYMKRLGGNFSFNWYADKSRKPGDVLDIEKEYPSAKLSYNAYTTHSFSNQAIRKEVLLAGTVHVAIGFVDLGLLLVSDLFPHIPGPLRFVGIERSAFAVAKTLVIWEVAKAGGSTPAETAHAMLQLWFSSSWSRPTIARFSSGVRAACRAETTPAVRALLEHWRASAGVSLKHARAAWAERSGGGGESFNRNAVGHFVRRADRIAAATYELTGDVGTDRYGDGELVGSILMFDCVDGTPPFEEEETVFGVLPMNRIAKAAATSDTDITVLAVIETMLVEGLVKLVDWASTSVVELELMHCGVEERVADIAALHPFTMSWSNLPDYFGYREFHSLARACSAKGDTIHFGYSMNWSNITWGVHLMDYGDASQRKMMLEMSAKAVKDLYEQQGLTTHLRTPVPTNPMNVVSWCNSMSLQNKWLQCWTAAAREAGPMSIGNSEPVIFNPLSSRGSNTLAMTWTYDPEITFKLKPHS